MANQIRKVGFLCSVCGRSLPVGEWYEGHWVCMWCRLSLGKNVRTGESAEIPPGRRYAVVEIEEIGTEL